MKTNPFYLGCLALLAFAAPAHAQYLYLDSNGDGVHTTADELHGTGPTVTDIWLDTGHNRDGSPTVCSANPAQPLTMFMYAVDLEASDGTISASPFTNRISQMALLYPPRATDGTHLSTGPFNMATGALPPGKYLLGTITLTVESGTPSIAVVPGINRSYYLDFTMFGSNCDGTDYPNSIVFGTDWTDADGLPYGTGGGPDQGPTVIQPADMTVPSGEAAAQTVTATDPEGQPLTLTKLSGPGFMFVTTVDQGAGTARGEIRLAPFASDVGTTTGSVIATDGTESGQATFGINVVAGGNHPPHLEPIDRLTVVAGQVANTLVSAGDADGGTIHISKGAGPAYVHVRELGARPGGRSALLTASPTMCDVGSATASISVTDGVSTVQRQVEITVISASPPPGSAVLRFPDPGSASAVGIEDLNGDGNLDVVITHEDRATVAVLLGLGNGNLGPAASYGVEGQNGALAIADFNQDHHLDVAVTNPGGASVSVLLGKGDGTLDPAISYPTGNGPAGIAAMDLNHDGIPDLATCNQEAGSVSALLSLGDGTFAGKRDSPAGFRPASIVLGDFNLDGRTDAALANKYPGSVGSHLTFLPGLGDGAFGDALASPLTGFPIWLVKGDWNWDGALDLAITDFLGTVQAFAGHGDGSFAAATTIAAAPILNQPWGIAGGDLNGDGNTDVTAGDIGFGHVLAMFGDGGGGFAAPVIAATEPTVVQNPAIGDMNSDGRPDLVTAGGFYVFVTLNRFPQAGGVQARAFEASGKTAGGADVCIRIEPVNSSYANADVDVATIALRSEGTGSLDEIHPFVPKKVDPGDTDGNGVAEIGACFSKADVTSLFGDLHGRTTVTAQLSGSLNGGRTFCTSVSLNIVGKPGRTRVAFSPNPLNPSSTLILTTGGEGPAKAMLFDLHGRLVRTIFDTPRLAVGRHEYAFDGKSDRGSELSSGVYFYRVESAGEQFRGRVIILK
ncbi:MAG TPA: FG-GAP-like repeat-containing protein [Candidatus Limnocylindrales bacterium]|nr:FG-GAP-like repeat-containing protein [Candidatus Limnocylindrales bacterium]